MTKTKITFAVAAAALAFTAAPALAQTVVLDFTGIATTSNNSPAINNFYNGGTSAAGTTGTNYGVTFSSNALAINSYNGGNEPNPGILYFLSGTSVFINYAAGFTSGFSFFYASSTAGSATIFDGLNGTGNALGTVAFTRNLSSTCSFCVWDSAGSSFAGTGRSIGFTGVADQVGFDQVTFGSAQAGGGAVPEPATWAMLMLGFGAVGYALRRRRQAVRVTYA